MSAQLILQPVLVLALLTVVVTVLMFGLRIRAMRQLKLSTKLGQDTANLRTLLPTHARRATNNYNHLFEQPTLFYALALTIALLGDVDNIHLTCAWIYAISRIAHSIVQCTVDFVPARFVAFIIGTIALVVMIIHEALLIF